MNFSLFSFELNLTAFLTENSITNRASTFPLISFMGNTNLCTASSIFQTRMFQRSLPFSENIQSSQIGLVSHQSLFIRAIRWINSGNFFIFGINIVKSTVHDGDTGGFGNIVVVFLAQNCSPKKEKDEIVSQIEWPKTFLIILIWHQLKI